MVRSAESIPQETLLKLETGNWKLDSLSPVVAMKTLSVAFRNYFSRPNTEVLVTFFSLEALIPYHLEEILNLTGAFFPVSSFQFPVSSFGFAQEAFPKVRSSWRTCDS